MPLSARSASIDAHCSTIASRHSLCARRRVGASRVGLLRLPARGRVRMGTSVQRRARTPAPIPMSVGPEQHQHQQRYGDDKYDEGSHGSLTSPMLIGGCYSHSPGSTNSVPHEAAPRANRKTGTASCRPRVVPDRLAHQRPRRLSPNTRRWARQIRRCSRLKCIGMGGRNR
jgi:hypothetical protein